MAEDALGLLGFRFRRDEDGNLIGNPNLVRDISRDLFDRTTFNNDFGNGGHPGRPFNRRNTEREERDPVEDPTDLIDFTEGFDFLF